MARNLLKRAEKSTLSELYRKTKRTVDDLRYRRSLSRFTPSSFPAPVSR